MTTVVLAWLTVAAACTGAVLFGQTARTAPLPRSAARRVRRRIGLVLSLTGPWAAVLLAVPAAAVTGLWLPAALWALVGVLLVAGAGLLLAPQ